MGMLSTLAMRKVDCAPTFDPCAVTFFGSTTNAIGETKGSLLFNTAVVYLQGLRSAGSIFLFKSSNGVLLDDDFPFCKTEMVRKLHQPWDNH